MNLIIASDHRGAQLQTILAKYFSEQMNMTVRVCTVNIAPVDYPDVSRDVASPISQGHYDRGILICGSGLGVAIAANRYPRVRAVTCRSADDAIAARTHNDANVLCLGADFTDVNAAMRIARAFMETTFDGDERHMRRIEKIETNR